MEAPVDTDKDGQLDLVKVTILRPNVDFPVPAMITASPYQQGTNEPASDKLTHKMEETCSSKQLVISLSHPEIKAPEADLTPINPVTKAQERFAHTDTYTLNDYMLARGVASIYVSGVGTFNSEGFMTSGDYQQVLAYKAVIDWLNGRHAPLLAATDSIQSLQIGLLVKDYYWTIILGYHVQRPCNNWR